MLVTMKIRIGKLASLVVAALLLVGAAPESAAGQSAADLIQALQAGGRWVDIPIRNGRGTLESDRVVTMGMGVRGCVRIWEGHSGTFDVRARETLGGETMTATVEPGESVPFSYRTGPRAQLSVEVEWSEPRDTTLHVWVGLERPADASGETCRPAERGAPGGP